MILARREKPEAKKEVEAEAAREPIRPTTLKDHVVLIGHGRVGSFISRVLRQRSTPLFVIEDDDDMVADLKAEGVEALSGNAADPEILQAANLGAARCLLVAIPDAFEGGQVVQQARAINAALPIIARAHSEAEIEHLLKHGASLVVMGEHEIAKAMIDNIASTVIPAKANQNTAAPAALRQWRALLQHRLDVGREGRIGVDEVADRARLDPVLHGEPENIDQLLAGVADEMGADDGVASLIDDDLRPGDRLGELPRREPIFHVVDLDADFSPFSFALASDRPTVASAGTV